MNYSVFSSHYFTDWILTATTLVSLVVSLVHRVHKQLFLIQIYIVASLFIDVLSTIRELLFSDSKLWLAINCATLNFYSISEIILIALFISNVIPKKNINKIIKTLCCIYVTFCVSLWLYFPTAITSDLHYLFALEGIFITIFCLFYFYEIIHTGFSIDISQDSNFIAICGILFYFSTSVPYYFSSYKLLELSPDSFIIYDCINYFFYTILFLSFIKAYLCPVLLQK